MSLLLDYLTTVAGWRSAPPAGWLYSCGEDFVLREGREYKPAPLPGNITRMRKKECFRNALLTAIRHPGLTYIEGYGISEGAGIPMMHAWCADADGNVVDPTWTDGIEYYGVPFSREFIGQVVGKLRYYGFIDAWRNGFPLLAGEWTGFKPGCGSKSRAPRGEAADSATRSQEGWAQSHSTSVRPGSNPGGERMPQKGARC